MTVMLRPQGPNMEGRSVEIRTARILKSLVRLAVGGSVVVYTTLDYSTSQSQVTRICAVAQKPKTTKVGRNWGVPGTLTTLWLRQPRLFVWRVNKYVPRTSVGVSICPRSCSTVTVAHPANWRT